MSSRQFILLRASKADMPEITRLEYRCFDPIVRELVHGLQVRSRHTSDGRKACPRNANGPLRSVGLMDSVTGKMVGASNWKFFVNGGAPPSSDEHPPKWLEGETRRQAEEMMGAMNHARRKANPGPRVHGHIAFTDPDYRGRGIASMVMQWGCDLADQLFLPAWIEPTADGSPLYRKFGFYDVEAKEGGLPGNCMRRDARTTGVEGGPVVTDGSKPKSKL